MASELLVEKPKTSEIKRFPHSVSAANAFRQCSRLYYNSYILGWQDAGTASWLKFGTKIDKLLEILDLNNLSVAIEAIPGMFDDVREQMDVEVLLTLWQRQFGSDPLPPVDLNGKNGSQYPFYVNFSGNPVTGFMSMTVSGKIDKVTIIDGEVGVFEGKTTKEPVDSHSAYWNKLEMDPQISCYVWGVSKDLGKPVNWVWYQVIRRPSEAAHPMFAKTYTRKKETFEYTEAEYRKRVFSILEGELKKPLMARRKLRIDEDRKNLWLTEHAQNYQDIQAKREKQALLEKEGLPPELAWPRNHFGCTMFGGCSFLESCLGKTTIEGCGKFVRRIKR